MRPLIDLAGWIKGGAYRTLSPTARDVLAVVASFAGPDDPAFPSAATIADLTGHTRTSIFKALKELVGAGVLVDLGRVKGKRAHRYGPRAFAIAAPPALQVPREDVPVTRTSSVSRDERGRFRCPSATDAEMSLPEGYDLSTDLIRRNQVAPLPLLPPSRGGNVVLDRTTTTPTPTRSRRKIQEREKLIAQLSSQLLTTPREELDGLVLALGSEYGAEAVHEARLLAAQLEPSWPMMESGNRFAVAAAPSGGPLKAEGSPQRSWELGPNARPRLEVNLERVRHLRENGWRLKAIARDLGIGFETLRHRLREERERLGVKG